jgi:hypothetical protein
MQPHFAMRACTRNTKRPDCFLGFLRWGGGALSLASRIEGATAVAINAQTDIFAYESKSVVEMVRKFCFSGHSVEDIKQRFSYRVDMSRAWKNNQISKIIFIQNRLDTHHYKYHFQPFWSALGGSPEGVRTKMVAITPGCTKIRADTGRQSPRKCSQKFFV